MRWRAAVSGSLIAIAAGSWLAAQPPPLGPQFQVNTYTTGYQATAAAAATPDGGFVVVWESYPGNHSDVKIQLRRFDAAGAALGDDFQVNTFTTYYQYRPAAAVGPSGEFVVVWESLGSSGSDLYYSIQARRFAADGTPSGAEFQVNSYTTGFQFDTDVAFTAAGEFIVVWTSEGTASDPEFGILGQRFAGDGMALGGEFEVNSYTTAIQSTPAIAVGPAGEFVVVWQSQGSAGSDDDYSIQGRRFAADATPLGDDFQVNSFTTDWQRFADVAMATDGGFVVAWESYASAGGDPDVSVQGRRFAADATPLGDDFQVNSFTTGQQRFPAVSGQPGGGFVVGWTSQGSAGSDTDGSSVQVRPYAADGTALAGEFQVNSYTTSSQTLGSVAAGPDGRLVVVWTSLGSPGNDSDASSIQGRRYESLALIFADGFESGDTSAWSGSTP